VGGKGYCIVLPSIHPDTGEAYRWESRRAPAILPDRLQGLLTPAPKPIYRPSNRNTSAVGLLRKVAETPEGNRNDALSGQLVALARMAFSTKSKINCSPRRSLPARPRPRRAARSRRHEGRRNDQET
jgi:hypothetical protein